MRYTFHSLDNKVFTYKTEKFHLNTLSFSFAFELTYCNATHINLLEEMLKDYIKIKLLYLPINFYIQTLKKDQLIILIIYFQYPQRAFLTSYKSYFKIIVDLYKNIIHWKAIAPFIITNFDYYKQMSLKKISSIEHDIKTIAIRNCFEVLNDNFVSLYGSKEILMGINKKNFNDWFLNSIFNNEISKQAFLVGNFEPKKEDIIGSNVPNSNDLRHSIFSQKTKLNNYPIVIKRMIKSNIGFLVYALQIDNPENYSKFSIKLLSEYLGGGGYSLLFNKIREKHMLVYQISSTCNPNKGEIIITAKVARNRLKKVLSKIDEEISMLQSQIVDDLIFSSTLKAMKLNEARIFDRPISLTRGFINLLTDFKNNNTFTEEEFVNLSKHIKKTVIVSISEE